MEIELVEKKDNRWVILLKSEGHTLANMIRELSWKFGGESAYRIEHPLLARPRVKVVGKDPKGIILKVAKEIQKMAGEVEKAF